jgi:hypothetical protein
MYRPYHVHYSHHARYPILSPISAKLPHPCTHRSTCTFPMSSRNRQSRHCHCRLAWYIRQPLSPPLPSELALLEPSSDQTRPHQLIAKALQTSHHQDIIPAILPTLSDCLLVRQPPLAQQHTKQAHQQQQACPLNTISALSLTTAHIPNDFQRLRHACPAPLAASSLPWPAAEPASASAAQARLEWEQGIAPRATPPTHCAFRLPIFLSPRSCQHLTAACRRPSRSRPRIRG